MNKLRVNAAMNACSIFAPKNSGLMKCKRGAPTNIAFLKTDVDSDGGGGGGVVSSLADTRKRPSGLTPTCKGSSGSSCSGFVPPEQSHGGPNCWPVATSPPPARLQRATTPAAPRHSWVPPPPPVPLADRPTRPLAERRATERSASRPPQERERPGIRNPAFQRTIRSLSRSKRCAGTGRQAGRQR